VSKPTIQPAKSSPKKTIPSNAAAVSGSKNSSGSQGPLYTMKLLSPSEPDPMYLRKSG
jgi:hypothetical protein